MGRKTLIATFVAAALAAASLASPCGADEYELKYRTLETRDLRVFYFFEEQAYIIEHLARCYENAWLYHQRFFGYHPSGPVTIFFNDADDYGYAGTTVIPENWITLGIEPFEYVYDTCPTNERMNWVMNHELVHVTASDQATGADSFFRKVFFGKVSPSDDDPISILWAYLTTPRLYAPRWYHEGIAVCMETWMAGGIGRTLTGYDEMTFRAMVRDSIDFYTVVGLESEGTAKDFQIGQMSYLYGTRFFSYLSLTYGPEKVIEWVRRNEGSSAYFAGQFKHVFGLGLDEAWKDWIAFEHQWQEANLDSIRQYPVTPCRFLSRPLGSVSREYFDPSTRTLYAAVNYPGEFSHIAAIDVDRGTMRKICEIETPALYYTTSLAWDDSSKTLFFTTDNSRGWRDINAVDVSTGRCRLLAKNARTGDLAFDRSDASLWGVRHHNGYSSIVRFSAPYDDGYELMRMRYGIDLFDIDISPDGAYLTGTLAEINGDQRLVRFETARLKVGEGLFEVLHEFKDNNAANFVFSPDGRYLYGTSYVTGTSNVFRFDTGTYRLEALSNFEVGAFRPLPVSADSMIAFLYTGDGFAPVMAPIAPIEDVCAVRYLGQAVYDAHPVVADWKLGSPRSISLDSLQIYKGEYKVFRSLGVTCAYPIVEGYKDYATVGVMLNLMDPVGFNMLDLAVSYTPDLALAGDERPHARFRYSRFPWTVSGYWNRADFYDLFGPTKVSRKGHSLSLAYEHSFIVDRPRRFGFDVGVAGYGNLEYLPDYQNVASTIRDFYTARASLNFSHYRRTIGGIGAEKGIAWSLNGYTTLVNGRLYPLFHATLDKGFLLPLDHSHVWLRTAAGYSFGDRDEPHSYFYFGGFGNNWVDHGEINRYREFYAFPGAELNEIGGTDFVKGTIEWTLPPLRFSRFGHPAVYANWATLALFGAGIKTDIEHEETSREVASAGVQLNLRIVFFSSLQTTFSAGYAQAFERGLGPRDEVMVSLKILR